MASLRKYGQQPKEAAHDQPDQPAGDCARSRPPETWQRRGDFVRSSSPILWENEAKFTAEATNLTKKVEQSAVEVTNLTKEVGQGIGEERSAVIGYEERRKAPSLAKTSVDDPEERAAIIECDGNIPRTWAEGFAALCAMPAPPGFSPGRWQRIVDAAGVFIDRWASIAIECSWSDLDVFGCNPVRPDVRFDYMGLVLLLDRFEITSIDRDGADLVSVTGARQRFRRRSLPSGAVSLWQLCIPGRPAA